MRPFATLALALLALPTAGDRPPSARSGGALAVRIVPTSDRDKTGREIGLFLTSQHFHVVLTNVSDAPVKLWRDWNSWGYHNLSFIIRDADGTVTRVTKRGRDWSKNFPDAMVVRPGDHMVLEVAFEPSVWDGVAEPTPGKSRAVRMQAVYAVAPDAETRKEGVWTGEVSSPEEAYTIYR